MRETNTDGPEREATGPSSNRTRASELEPHSRNGHAGHCTFGAVGLTHSHTLPAAAAAALQQHDTLPVELTVALIISVTLACEVVKALEVLSDRTGHVTDEPLEPLSVSNVDTLFGINVEVAVPGDRCVEISIGALEGAKLSNTSLSAGCPRSRTNRCPARRGVAGGEARLIEQELPLGLVSWRFCRGRRLDQLSAASPLSGHLREAVRAPAPKKAISHVACGAPASPARGCVPAASRAQLRRDLALSKHPPRFPHPGGETYFSRIASSTSRSQCWRGSSSCRRCQTA